MGIFSSIQRVASSVVNSTFGNLATWQPSNSSQVFTALVLYKDPTEQQKISDQNFEIERYQMEYSEKDFLGLKDLVSGSATERLSIQTDDNITLNFFVKRVESKYDGKTFIAFLNPID